MTFPYRFCPGCGAWLNPPGHGVIEQVCLACGTVHYHNAKPCAGAFVMCDGKVMLVRRGIEPFKNFWDIPGGFLEPDEHPRQGAIREVWEETGLHIRITDMQGIYIDEYVCDEARSYYTLNIYYRAEIVDGHPVPQSDAVAIGWFGPDEIPAEIAFKHARTALAEWAASEESREGQGDAGRTYHNDCGAQNRSSVGRSIANDESA